MKQYSIKLIGGDFQGDGTYIDRVLSLPRKGAKSERIHIGCCKIDQLTADKSKSFGGSAAAGLAGGLLLGPAGLLAGALAGGNKAQVTFVIELDDGRKTVGQAHPELYTKLIADRITATCQPVPEVKPGSAAAGCVAIVAIFLFIGVMANMCARAGGL